jgi:hypothetical protein
MPIKYKETVDEARNYPALSDMVEQYDFHKPL